VERSTNDLKIIATLFSPTNSLHVRVLIRSL
jgi:hypothetical protein